MVIRAHGIEWILGYGILVTNYSKDVLFFLTLFHLVIKFGSVYLPESRNWDDTKWGDDYVNSSFNFS